MYHDQVKLQRVYTPPAQVDIRTMATWDLSDIYALALRPP